MAERLSIEVSYARPGQAFCIPLELSEPVTIREAIERSGLLQLCPEIDLAHNRVGIFGRLCALEDRPASGDRVEIYRPLEVDPKTARRLRAAGRGYQS